MSLPAFDMRELIEAGVHFGHKTRRWNPRMAPYIYGVRNDVHIINLGKTVPMLQEALSAVRDVVAQNGRILFVGTKRQASEPVAEAAERCGQYYINQRWLGGCLTNWSTIQNSIKTLRHLEQELENPEESGFTKKELLAMTRQKDKLVASLGGIKDMGGLPDMLFIIDTGREDLAVNEAKKLGIPIVAVVDSNNSADNIDYPIPGNDDSARAIRLYCRLISDAALGGIQQSLTASDEDVGEREDVAEILSVEDHAAAKAAPKKAAKKPATKKPAKAKVDEKADATEEKGDAKKKPAAKKATKKAPEVTVKKSRSPKAAAAKKAEEKK